MFHLDETFAEDEFAGVVFVREDDFGFRFFRVFQAFLFMFRGEKREKKSTKFNINQYEKMIYE